MIEIVEVKTKKQHKLFANYPLVLFKDCPYYVPSLFSDEMNIDNPKVNLAAKDCKVKCFLAYKDGVLAGRVAGIIQLKYNREYNAKCIRFSRFDYINDIEVVEKLLEAVKQFGRENGLDTIHGPWGFNDTDREGMLTYGFGRRSTYATNYSYEYYPQIMEALGYQKESEWLELKFDIPDQPIEKLHKLAQFVAKKFSLRDITLEISLKQFIKQYGDKFFALFNACYHKLDGFVDIDDEVKNSVLKQFATIINPRFYSMIVNEQDEIVAFGVAIPSICEALKKNHGKLLPFGFIPLISSINKPKELELALVGIHPDYRKFGVNAMMIDKMLTNTIEAGIKDVESNLTLVENTAVRAQFDKVVTSEVIKKRQTYVSHF